MLLEEAFSESNVATQHADWYLKQVSGSIRMSLRRDLVATATSEWVRFGKDTGREDHFVTATGETTKSKRSGGEINPPKETVEPYSSRIADYWLAVPSKDYDRLVRKFAKHVGRLDGTVNLAWSAAFISYCMQMAGAGKAFPYAPGHATWIVKSIANRSAGKFNASLVGFEPGERPLEVGDLVGKSRVQGVTYANAVATGWFESHSDIVCEVDPAKRSAFVIGGNVGQSVSRIEVALRADGTISASGGWIVHIKNNIAPSATLVASAATGAEEKVG